MLFFLAADVIVRRVFRLRRVEGGVDELATISRSYGGQTTAPDGRNLRRPGRRPPHPATRLSRRRRRLERPDHHGAGRPARPGSAVRRPQRALRGRQYRDRRHDARERLHGLVRGVCRSSKAGTQRTRRVLRRHAAPTHRGRCGALTGLLLSAIHAWLSISVRADQIISGTIINIVAFGVTGYLNLLLAAARLRRRASSTPFVPPAFLTDLPVVGWIVRMFLAQGPITMRRSSWPSSSRSCCSGRAGASGRGPSVSTRGRPRPSGSASSRRAIATSSWADCWPGSRARGSRSTSGTRSRQG